MSAHKPAMRVGAAALLAAMAMGIVLVACAALVACSSGGSSSPPPKPERITIPLPPFTLYSTDLSDLNEGTVGDPLRLASPPCKLAPFWDQQQGLCQGVSATVWTASNAVATTTDWNRWRYVVNVEAAWDTHCNTGPPNQSYSLFAAPITFAPLAASVDYGFTIANESDLCQKIPYVAAAYIRGVQGDTQRRVASWDSQPVLTFDIAYARSIGPNFAQDNYVWAYYADPVTGTRYMAQAFLWNSGFLDGMTPITFNWNWPAVDSYYYPGAVLHLGNYTDCPLAVSQAPTATGARWTIDTQALALCRYPELATASAKPDFLGFEIAVEGAYMDYVHPAGLPNRMVATLSGVSLTVKP